jgi:hypothetical protein
VLAIRAVRTNRRLRAAPAAFLVAAVVSLGACGTTHSGSAPAVTTPVAGPGTTIEAPPTTAASPLLAPTTTAPKAAVAGRLAIGTGQGMEVWSSTTGVFAVGPTVQGVVVSDIRWSLDGRFLAWQTTPSGGSGGTELWYADVAHGIVHHWGPLRHGGAFGAVVVTDDGVLTFGRRIVRYLPGGGTSIVGRSATPDETGSAVEAWSHGWVVEPRRVNGLTVRRLDTAGTVLAPTVTLGGAVANGPRFGLDTVDFAGRRFAAALGTAQRTCGGGGSVELWSASLVTGVVRHSPPPATTQGEALRIWGIDVSGTPSAVYTSTFSCPAHVRPGTVITTTLWRYAAGGWERLGPHLLLADDSPTGVLATLGGDVREGRSGPVTATGSGRVEVEGTVVATGGRSIEWAPVGRR